MGPRTTKAAFSGAIICFLLAIVVGGFLVCADDCCQIGRCTTCPDSHNGARMIGLAPSAEPGDPLMALDCRLSVVADHSTAADPVFEFDHPPRLFS